VLKRQLQHRAEASLPHSIIPLARLGVLKRQLQHRAEASLPHSIVALARLGGEGNTARLF